VASLDAGAGFAAHGNVGGVVRGGEGQRDALLAAVGVDHRTSQRLTVAVEALAQLPLGADPLVRREVVIRDALGGDRVVATSTCPRWTTTSSGTVGFKFRVSRLALVGDAVRR
jgi:hypothetical protein